MDQFSSKTKFMVPNFDETTVLRQIRMPNLGQSLVVSTDRKSLNRSSGKSDVFKTSLKTWVFLILQLGVKDFSRFASPCQKMDSKSNLPLSDGLRIPGIERLAWIGMSAMFSTYPQSLSPVRTGAFLKQGGMSEFWGFGRDSWRACGGNFEEIWWTLQEMWRTLRGD